MTRDPDGTRVDVEVGQVALESLRVVVDAVVEAAILPPAFAALATGKQLGGRAAGVVLCDPLRHPTNPTAQLLATQPRSMEQLAAPQGVG